MVVDITPLILEVSSNELVDVEIVSVLLLMIVEVETEPPMLEVSVFPSEDKILDTVRLATEKLSAVKLLVLILPAKRLLVVADVNVALVKLALPFNILAFPMLVAPAPLVLILVFPNIVFTAPMPVANIWF